MWTSTKIKIVLNYAKLSFNRSSARVGTYPDKKKPCYYKQVTNE